METNVENVGGNQNGTNTEGATEGATEGGIKRNRKNSNTRNKEGSGTTEKTFIAPTLVEIPIMNTPATSISKRSKSAKKDEETAEMSANIAMLVGLGFNFAATRMGNHWAISDVEAKAISDPAAKIMNRLGVSTTANKYMDYFSLFAGLAIVIIPRAMITSNPTATQEEKNNGRKKTTTGEFSQPIMGEQPPNITSVGDAFKDIINGTGY